MLDMVRKLCVLLLVAVNARVGLAESHLADDRLRAPRPISSKVVARGEVTFAIRDARGETPEIFLLRGTVAARMLNLAQRRSGNEIRMQFVGLVLGASASDSDQINVRLVGRTQQVPLPSTISRRALEAGERITLDFPPMEKTFAGNRVVGSAKLVLQYDPKRKIIQIHEASGRLSVKTWAGTTSDAQSLHGLTATPAALDLSDKPVRRY